VIDAGNLDRLVTVESATIARDSATGAEVKTWAQLGSAFWAQVVESATANDEGLASGVATFARPTRVRCRYRSDIDPTMRINLGGGRLLQIIGTAMLGRLEGLELACKEWAHDQ
jgi:head-tail adaptor